jgi:hypothetical protein
MEVFFAKHLLSHDTKAIPPRYGLAPQSGRHRRPQFPILVCCSLIIYSVFAIKRSTQDLPILFLRLGTDICDPTQQP